MEKRERLVEVKPCHYEYQMVEVPDGTPPDPVYVLSDEEKAEMYDSMRDDFRRASYRTGNCESWLAYGLEGSRKFSKPIGGR